MSGLVKHKNNPNKDKVLTTLVANPFDRADGRQVKFVRFIPGMTAMDVAIDLLPAEIPLDQVAVVVNGSICEAPDLRRLLPGDSVAVIPKIGGKTFGRVLATVAVIVMAYFAPQLLPAALQKGFIASMVSAGVMFAGMTIVNSLFPIPEPKLPVKNSSSDSSQSYGWGSPMSHWGPGNPIGVLYGKALIPGQVINYFMTTDNSTYNQTAYLLMAMCYGLVETPATEPPQIYINGRAKLDSFGDTDFEIQSTFGSPDQTVLSNFDKLHQFRFYQTPITLTQLVLLHFDVTPFEDSSQRELTVVTGAGATRSTTDVKFGNGSLDLDGSGDATTSVTVQNIDENFTWFHDNAVCVDFWFKLDAYPNSTWEETEFGNWYTSELHVFFSAGNFSTGNSVRLVLSGNLLDDETFVFIFETLYGGQTECSLTSNGLTTTDLPLSTWMHLELSKVQNNSVLLKLDGDEIGRSVFTRSTEDGTPSPDLIIGMQAAVGGSYSINGRIDEFQVLAGRSSHVGLFTPETAPYNTTTGINFPGRSVANSISMNFECPSGLFEIDDDTAEFVNNQIDFEIEIKEQSEPESEWKRFTVTVPIENGSEKPSLGDEIEGATSGAKGFFSASMAAEGTLDSQTWAGNFYGGITLSTVSGTFVLGETLQNNTTTTADIGNVPSIEGSIKLRHYVSLISKETTPLRYSTIADYLEEGVYDLRVNRLTLEESSPKSKSDLYCMGIDEVYHKTLIYPNVSLLMVSIPASNSMAGNLPDLSAIWDRGTITVPNFNGVGTMQKSSDNPAWAVYDVFTNTLYGVALDLTKIDQASFEDWADWCDELVEGNKRVTVNGLIDTKNLDIRGALEMLCQIGRASIIQIGSRVKVVIEKTATPVQLFSTGNIVGDFKLEYIRQDSLPDSFIIEFKDREKDYVSSSVRINCNGYDSITNPKPPETLQLWGCTDKDVAIRYGIVRMQLTRKLNRIVSFNADIDAIACQVGDVILVQHDNNELTFGGRTDTNIVTGEVVLQETINLPSATFGSGNCKIWIKGNADDVVAERTVTGPFGVDTNMVEISVPISGSLLTADNVYMIGRATGEVVQYRVITVERDVDSVMTISALEYDESVYYHSAYGSGAVEI